MSNPKWCPFIKKKTGQIIHIFDPSLFQNYFVVITPSQKEFIKIVKRQLGITIDYDWECDGHFYPVTQSIRGKKSPVALVWGDGKVATLVHECFHTIWWSFCRKGIEITKDNDEAFAYHLEFLVRAILEK